MLRHSFGPSPEIDLAQIFMSEPDRDSGGVSAPETINRLIPRNSQPTETTTGVEGDRSYYSFRNVFGKSLSFGVVGGAGFIGKFFLEAASGNEINITSVLLSGNSETSSDAKQLAILQTKTGLSDGQVATSYQQILNNPNINAVFIATPNNSHFELAKAALEAGKHVLCEKPITITVAEAEGLANLAEEKGLLLVTNHFYSQYSQIANLAAIMKMPASDRSLVIDPSRFREELNLGSSPFEVKLGQVTGVSSSYIQDWVLQAVRAKIDSNDSSMSKPDFGIWRLNPKISGVSCCFGDIGSHCMEVLTCILGTPPVGIQYANLTKEVLGRQVLLDVDARVGVLFPLGNGRNIEAKIHSSQIQQGHQNDLSVTLHFEGGTLKWNNRQPNLIYLSNIPCKPDTTIPLERGVPPLSDLSSEAQLHQGVVAGHDQGHPWAQRRLVEMFSSEIARLAIEDNAVRQGSHLPSQGQGSYLPLGTTVGVAVMRMINQAVRMRTFSLSISKSGQVITRIE